MVGDFEHVDLASLIAPQPLMMQAGKQDGSFLVEDAQRSYEGLIELYGMLSGGERIALDVFEGGHEFDLDPALDWFQQWL